MKNANENIGVFGSSFNPPHLGHQAVLQDLLKKGLFDEIWLLPVFSHAFAKKLLPYEKRLEMTKLLAESLHSDKIKVSTAEKDLNKSPSYTFDIVSHFINKFPNHNYTLILGSDVRNDIHKWHKVEELNKIVSFYFIPRKGYENSPYPEVSSSEILERLKKGEPVAHLVPNEIATYISRHPLDIS